MLANKDAINAGFEADRVTYQGTNVATFSPLYLAFFYTADILFVTEAINKAKEFADNVGNIDRLRNENIELNKLNQSMSVELKTVKESLTKAEQALEMEKQSKIDALRGVQDRLDKRLDESVAIDSQLLSKSYLKDPVLIIFVKLIKLC